MRGTRAILTVLATTVLLLGTVAATDHQSTTEGCDYFSETGHYVCSTFLDFFHQRGGVEIFGFPLTEAFEDPTHGGLWVQYFQRARMERYPRNPEPYKVQLGLLVDELGYRYPPARPEQIPASDSALHLYFPETQHVVSYAFLDYFREKGGLDIFGYPRSEFMYEGGYIVQYFQRARMEWHPENAARAQMCLTDLGEVYIERFGLPGDYDAPLPPPIPGEPTSSVTRLRVDATVRYAITGRQGTQTVFVYVVDQRGLPVEDARAAMVVHYPSEEQRHVFEPTDARGFTRRSFEISYPPPGKRVVIDVSVTYADLSGSTQTFFLPWW